MSVELTLPPGEEPPWERLRAAVADRVVHGSLRPGDRLPTVRALATDLGLAPNTVAKSYRALEQAGVIETRGRAGSFVTGDRVRASAREAAAAYVERVRALGLDDAETLDLVRRLVGEHPPGGPGDSLTP